MHFWKMISTFYKDYTEKFIAISLPLDSTPPIIMPTVNLTTKQKYGRLAQAVKQAKKAWFQIFQY